MTKIYVASYVTEFDYDGLINSGETHGYTMADFAQGFTIAAGTDHARVLAQAERKFAEEYAETNDEADSNADFVFDTMEVMCEQLDDEGLGNEYRIEFLGDDIGVIVIRAFEEA